MARLPNLVTFKCTACHKKVSKTLQASKSFIPFRSRYGFADGGRCKKCDGDDWVLIVEYTDTEVATTVTDAFVMNLDHESSLLQNSRTNSKEYPFVTGDMVVELTAVPKISYRLIYEFAIARDRDDLIAKGAIECKNCEALFVPTPDKAWTQSGYCSKACAVAGGLPIKKEKAESSKSKPSTSAQKVVATCVNDHSFDVPLSFKGMMRPCPTCGDKTQVPSE